MKDPKQDKPLPEWSPEWEQMQAVYGAPVDPVLKQKQEEAAKQPFRPDLQNMQMTYGPPPGMQTSGFMRQMGLFAQQQSQPPVLQEGEWLCSCGAKNNGKFCMTCGLPKPEKPEGTWICTCGTQSDGNFCPECGKPRTNS